MLSCTVSGLITDPNHEPKGKFRSFKLFISSVMAAAERSCYFSVAVVRHSDQAAYRRKNLLGAYGSEGESMTTR